MFTYSIPYVAPGIKASYNGDLEGLKKLRDTGYFPDPSAGDFQNRTALHFAVKQNQIEIVKYLITLGVRGLVKDRWDAFALDYAEPGSEIYTMLKNIGARLNKR